MTTLGKLVMAGVLVVLVAIGAGVYYLAHRTSTQPIACTMEAKICPDGTAVGRTGPNCEFAACPTPPSTLNADVYPLYSKATWQPVAATRMTIGTSSLMGLVATSTASATTSNIAGIAMPFVTYYDTKLTAAGWSHDIQLDADGAGSSIRVYKKGLDVVELGYNSDFQTISEDVPAQCPCTVSFSLFTGSIGTSTSR